jgi:hypothetical protein
MTEREFCFWLRGYICDGDVKALDEKQLKTIRDHLGRVVKPSLEKKEETKPVRRQKIDAFSVYS